MINFMKNSLISRFVMLFLFVFGCGTMSPIPALAGGDSYEIDFYCADGSLATLPNGNGAIIFLEDGFDCSEITVPTSCDGKTVLSWKDTQHSAGTNILSQDVCDYAQYIFNNGIDSFISLKPETYESVTFTVEYCFPLEHTQASFDECLWNKICDMCDQITIDATYCPDRASSFDYSTGNNVTSYYVPALDTKVSPTDIGQCELLYTINESGNSDHRLIESSWTDYSTGDIVPIGYKRVKFYNNSGAYVTYRDYDMSVYEGNLPTASSLGISAPSGKSFYGWTFAGDSNCSIDFGVISTSDTIVEALSACSGNTYTAHPAYADNVNVVFYANGGSGSAPTSYTCNMKSCILPSNPYTRTGYTFTGWLVEDGSINFTGADYIAQPGTNIVSKFGANQADVSITLTAQWKQSCNAITIKGSTRGGSGTYKIYKKTGSSTVYSNSTCTTAITSVPAAMSTSVTKTNAMFAGTTNDCIKVTETTQDNVSLSFNTASTCNVTAATTWDARFYCNSYWRGSGKNLTGACTGSGVNFVYFKDSSKSNAVASQHCVYGSGCYTYNINDLYGVKVGYTAGSYLYDCLSGSWAADNLCDGYNNNPTEGQIPEETSLSDYVTQYIDNFMADNYTQDTIYGDTVLNIGLYPYWIEAANTLEVYQSASATTAYSTVSCPYGSDASVCLPTDKRPSKTGYTLVGFCRGKTDSCTDVIGLDGTELSTLASGGTTVQLTAKWNPNTYTITLNQDGGNGGQSSVTVVSGQVPPTLTSLPTKDGYTFGGYGIYNEGKEEWQSVYYNADGTGVVYDYGADITLYAIWNPKVYDVTLYANGCTGYPKTIQLTQGQTMSILPSTIDNCDSCGALSGWYDVANPDENSLLIMSSDTYRNDVHGTEFYAQFVSVKTPCSAGYYLPKGLAGLGSEVCVECPAGFYCGGGELECSNGGDVGIASCPNGYTSDKGAADSIEDCYISIPAGKYLDTAKSATLKDCPAGYYCPAQSKVYYGKISDKKSCSAGTYSDTTNAASCTSCPAGYYCPDNNMTSPTVCSGNTYSNAKGAKTCTSCPTGYSISGTEYTNHDAKSDCTISCGAGTYVKTADGACVNAGVGYYMAAHTVAAGTIETPNQCPNGGTTSGETTSAIASCYKVLSGCTVSGVTGTGKKTCYYTSGSGSSAVYNTSCSACAIDNCPTGYELVNGTCNVKTYTITLNDNGGSGGLGTVKEVYNTRWTNSASETITTVTVPVRSGYSFSGYYTSATGGTPRIGANGALPSNTTFTANTPLYAQWTPKSYTIKYVSTTSGRLGEQDCTYGETCIVGQAVAGAVTQTGSTFNGIWINDEVTCGTGSMEQGKDMNVDYLTCSAAFADANNDELPVLKADFTPNTYYVKYDANGGTGTIGNTTCTYGTVCRLTESGFTKDGYTLLGWSLSKTATTATYTDKATNLTETNGATITLYAVWGSCTPCTTSVGAYCYLDTSNGICEYNSGCNPGYSKQSGSTDAKPLCSPNLMKLPVYKTILDANNDAIPVTYINVYYNSKVPETFDTSVFSRSGYSIAGISGIDEYFTGLYYDGDGNRYSDRTVTDTGCKFYAEWNANTYAVTLDSPDAYDHGTAVVYYKYEQDEDCIYYADMNAEQCLSENKGTKIKSPARVGYSFRGYYTGNSGTGTEYVDDTGTISETLYSTVADNSTLKADWEVNEYTLTFNANSGSGTAPTITTCTYESCVLPENPYTKVGHVFSGWYFDPNDDGEIEAQPGENIGQYLANSVAGQTIEITAGWIPCSAGNYCPGDNTSIPCAVGSYSAAGASSCTACQDGTTTTAAGQTYCDATCTNAANAATWTDAKWLTNNELSYRCAIDTCKTGYYRDGTGDSTFGTSYTCDPNTYTITYSCGDGATGTPPANQTVTYNQFYTSEKTIGTCTKEGYVVEGWNTTVTGGTTVPIASYPGASGTWTFTENKTFTARWKPKCYEVDIEYSYDGQIDYNSYYIKHGDSSVVYSDVQCTQETYIDQYDTGHDGNGDFVGLYDDDDNMCMDDTGELSGDCLADADGYTWTALYSCNSGYTAHGDTVWAGDICSNCYQVKLSPAEGYSDADFLYTDGTENYVDAMCQNPYQGIIAPDKENATWVGYTNRSWDKNYTGEYPTDALCTSDESQGANTGKCAVTDNNQTWTAVYKCNDGYTANGTYVDYNTECSQNVYSVDLVYYCSDPTGAGDESTPPEKPSVCYSDGTCIMPENSCYYEGYQFTGWRVNCDTCGDNSKIYAQPGDDISWQINAIENGYTWDIDAMWKPNTYTVVYNANDGSSTISNQSRTYNDGAKLTANTFVRTGYTFAGWNTAADGTGTSYGDQATGNLSNTNGATVTLYAQWTQNVYTVIIPYSCGDSSGNAPSTLICRSSDTSCILSQPENCKKEDFVFVGWTLNNELQFTGDDIKSLATAANNGKTYTATAEYAKTAFTMTVKPLSSGNAGFSLGRGVTGVFAVDWGDNTTTTVNKTSTTAAQDVTHVYSDVNNEYLIQIASLADSVKDNSARYGQASLFVSDEFAPTILKLGGAGLGYLFQGSKLSIFSSVSNNTRVGAFANATNLVEISPTLFNGYTEVNSYFAYAMFTGCTSLKTASLDLFDGLVPATSASSVFGYMFKDCINLTTITNQSAYQTPFIPMDLYYNSLTSSQLNGVFTNTGLQSTCPDGFSTKTGSLIYAKPVCQPNEFTVTTTSDTSEFSFTLSAAGTYYIDWGDSTQVVTLTEPKSSSAMHVVSHTYDTAAAYDIKLAGQATKYYPDGTWGMNTSSISFANNTNVAKINGSLGAIFGTLESTGTAGEQLQPRFKDTFSQCSKLTGEIPADLFSGITGQPSRRMFQNTFFKTNVSGDIPADLFAGINGEVTDYLFAQTFYNCSGLTGQIPEKLFKGITGELTSASNRTNAFNGTFYGCSNLGKDTDGASLTLPVDLFAGLSTANYEGGQMADIFGNTGFAITCSDGEYKVTVTEYPFVSDWSNKAMCMTCPTDEIRTATSVTGNNNGKNSCYVTCPSTITVANAKTVVVVDGTPNYNGSAYPACTYTATCNDGYSVQNNGTANPSCTANTYTVTYDANGGTGTTASSSHTYDVSKALTANGFTNGTKKFLGWSTSKTATSATYTNKQSVKNLTATNEGTVTLYAIWSDCQACSAGTGATCTLSAPLGVCTYTTVCKTGYNTLTNSGKYNPSCTANTYTVAYNANDGTGTMGNQSRTYNDGAKLTANTFTRTGYTFVGWNTTADGTGTSYGDQATDNLTSTNGATVTLYAQWGQCQACNAGTGASCSMIVTNNTCTYTTACKTGYNTLTNSGKYNPSCTANTYTVTYSCGDGDGTAPNATTATYDSVFTMAQNTCSKTGYDFVGWVAANTDDAVYQAEQKFNWTYLENKTFVAQWSAKRITCTSGEFLDRTTCAPCSVGFKCPAASVTYTYNADIQGRTACSGTSQYQNQTGQTVCKTVDDGYYKISDTAQAVCGNNFYCKNSVRIQCPDGGITNTETASLGSQCYKSGLSCTTDGGFGTNTCNYDLTTNDYTDCTECGINKCADGYYMDGNACEICPAGSFCANNVKTLCPPNYTTTDVGAVLKTQCVTTCSDKDVVYGTAYKDAATVLWPAVCTHTYGISVTGNPCKIIDNVCVETSCKYDYEMIDGKCELCVRDNALGFKQGNGNCIVETCLYGYRPFGQSCISDTIECSADGAVAAEQKWNPNTNSFGPCTIIECATGYHIEENSCVLDTQACTIENGTGEKVYDHDLGKWGECVVSTCLPGYTNNPKLTHETWKPCGRCNNMFGTNGERIVSSYLTECEIASCMYQGEKYTLENNECISICDERSDETGSRYWDGNKCVHDCKPGFLKW